jgi:hypothetical protein
MPEETRQPRPEPVVLNWNENEAALLRSFLDKSPQFLPCLRAKRPKVSKTETIEARAMSGSEIRGAEHMIDAIVQLAGGAQTITEHSPFIGRENE